MATTNMTWQRMVDRMRDYAEQPLTRRALLQAHFDYAWDRIQLSLEGLGDDEYFWEPVAGCWTVRRQANGTFMADWAAPEPSPAPFTTIAWRLSHMGFLVNLRANHYFGDSTLDPLNAPWPGSATAAVEWLSKGVHDYRSGLAGLTEDDLDTPPDGPPGYLDGTFPLALCVQHVTLELIHHGAEVSLLRDLYRVRDVRPST